MKVTFLGTRENIPIRSRTHQRHSTVMLSGRKGRVLIDCGERLAGAVRPFRPAAILVTQGHPDHAAGLKRGAACPVYATAETWKIMARWPLAVRRELPVRDPITIAGFVIEAWPVQHSLNAPAVGFKVSGHGACLFYVPDVAALDHSKRLPENVDVYVGDGAVLVRSLVRSRGSALIGHASVATQLDWCRKAGVGRAIFTHCGSGIVRSNVKDTEAVVQSLGGERGVHARLACDGLTVRLRRGLCRP